MAMSILQPCIQKSTCEQPCSNDGFISLDNSSNASQKRIAILSSNSEMQLTTQPSQKVMTAQNNSHNDDDDDDDLRHCAISTDMLQFFLKELIPKNLECASEIHSMKFSQEWTFAELYNACAEKSMHIPEESALAEFNVIIQHHLHLLKNTCIELRCTHLIKKMSQSIKRRSRQCLQIKKSSKDDRKRLKNIKHMYKKKSMETASQEITKCQQQCPEMAKICRCDNATIAIIIEKIQKSFWGLDYNYSSLQTQRRAAEILRQQHDPQNLLANITTSSLNGSKERGDEVSVPRKKRRNNLTEEALVHQSPSKKKCRTTISSVDDSYPTHTISSCDKDDTSVNDSMMNCYYFSPYAAHNMLPSTQPVPISYSFQQATTTNNDLIRVNDHVPVPDRAFAANPLSMNDSNNKIIWDGISHPSTEEMSRHKDVQCHCRPQLLHALQDYKTPESLTAMPQKLIQNGVLLDDIIQTGINNDISPKYHPIFKAMHHTSDAKSIARIIISHGYYVKQLNLCTQVLQSEKFKQNPIQTLIEQEEQITNSMTIINQAINCFSDYLTNHLNGRPLISIEKQYAEYIQRRIDALIKENHDCLGLNQALRELQTYFKEENESDFAARSQKLVYTWQSMLPGLKHDLQTLELHLLQQATQIKQMQKEEISRHCSEALKFIQETMWI